jgi:hypothetical protein
MLFHFLYITTSNVFPVQGVHTVTVFGKTRRILVVTIIVVTKKRRSTQKRRFAKNQLFLFL